MWPKGCRLAYAFALTDRSLQRGLARIARQQLRRALSLTTPGALPQAEAVHEIRKSVKRLRALLRLVRPALSDHARLDAGLRDAARALAPLREADVQAATLALLLPLAPAPLASALSLAFAAPSPGTGINVTEATQAMARCRARLQSVAEPLSKLRLGGGQALLETGLAATLQAAHRRWAVTLRGDSPEALHAFRKRIKDHGYHARLLAPIWPEAMLPHASAADLLGEMLGDINDLANFRATLATIELSADHRHAADALAKAQQTGLLLTAHPLAARLLADPPRALAQRWCRWWEIWRS